ncbi:MFS transporter [Rhodococcus antarcticus]|uniref:MFS transporter n=1 Tax=Rhodococcus antarcticus TaxID=2987751 RepID=A0ABY6P457_9NOCA|nr:MFS transporter [Rhodococcus antarcticus]UZJ26450.1 MFS transporter [Rhodococcus antarcticus]
MVALAATATIATAPGQTAAVSAFLDPMIAELGLSRSTVSTAYLVGTLAGAAAMPFVGRTLDRVGPRRTMAVVGLLFGLVLLAMSAVSGVVGLTAGFVGIRLAGQGALGLVATTVTALWFTRRRGLAIGIVTATGSAGISLAPVLLERVIAGVGWRTTWALEGLVVLAVVLPVAVLGLRDRPADLGQHPDGRVPTDEETRAAGSGLTRAQAVRTPFFWTVLAGVAASGMLCTAVAFHQVALLGERGFSTAAAAANFLPQTAASLVATLAVGALVDRVSPRWLTTAAMTSLVLGLVWGSVVAPGWSSIGFAAAIGAAGGSIRSLESASFPRYFGTTHIGSIRGLVAAVSVGSTAFGPVLFALVRDATGSFAPALLGGAVLPAAVAVVALFVTPPPVHGSPDPGEDTSGPPGGLAPAGGDVQVGLPSAGR